MITRLALTVAGRPAPQGSKKLGQQGQLLEQSPYLRAWRAAVKRAVYVEYLRLFVLPDALPLLRGAVMFSATYRMGDIPIDGPPDLDKLLRSTWDGLTAARAWEDDGRVTRIRDVEQVAGGPLGADIVIELA